MTTLWHTGKGVPRKWCFLPAAVAALSACSDPGASLSARRAGEAAPSPVLVSRVYPHDVVDRDRLAAELDVLEQADPVAGWIGALLSPEERDELGFQGYRVEIDERATERLNQPPPVADGFGGGIPGYFCYRTVEETQTAMANIASAHPGLATWVDIGDTWEKVRPGGNAGYDLNVLVLGNKARSGPKPILFLMGAIHAREYTTAETVARFAEHLVGAYGLDPDVTWLLDHFEAHLLFHSNPDGRKIAEQGYLQRKNTDTTNGSCSVPPTGSNQYGIDLNRNSSFMWDGSGSSTSPCTQTYRGPAAGSAPEVHAIQTYLRAIFPDQRGPGMGDPAPLTASGVMITLHSYSRLVLFPWGATSSPAPNLLGLQTLGRKFGFHNGYQVCQPPICLYAASGTTDDFAYGELGVAAYTFEIGDNFFEGCQAFETELYPTNLNALLYAFKAARRPYQNPGGPEVVGVRVSPASVIAGEVAQLGAIADDTRSASNGSGSEPVQAITQARYSVDVPPWTPGAVLRELSASDGAFSSAVEELGAAIDTTGWGPGRHTVFVEAKDASGAWGVPTAVFLDVRPRIIGMQVAPGASARDGEFGAAVTYALAVTNTGNAPDTFTVSLSGGQWPYSAQHLVGPVAAGATATFPVTVEVPLDAALGAVDSAWVMVTSRADAAHGTSVQLSTRALSADAEAPAVAILSPAMGATVSGVVRIEVQATDNREVTRVELRAGGALLETRTSAPFELEWDTAGASDGPLLLMARAYDGMGNWTDSEVVEVRVANRGGCARGEQLLVNGDFEAGEQGWSVVGSDVVDEREDTPAHGGVREASLLGYGAEASEELSQVVAIPKDACSATLTSWIHVQSDDLGEGAGDRLEVVARDEVTGVERMLATFSGADRAFFYGPVKLDVAALRGSKARIVFRATEDKAGATTFLIDDVALDVELPESFTAR